MAFGDVPEPKGIMGFLLTVSTVFPKVLKTIEVNGGQYYWLELLWFGKYRKVKITGGR